MTPPEKCDSDFRFYRASAVAFILAALAIKVGLVVSGTILSGPGDDSNRIYHAIRWSLDPSVTFSSRFLTDIWPHGPKILMGLPLLLFRSIGLGGIVDPVKACLIETAAIYSVCAYLVFLIVTRLVDSRSGFLAVASLYAMEIQSRMALSGMAEVYCLLAILISILCFLNWDGRSMASKWFVVATLASLASTLFRGDMILFIGIFGLILLWKKKFLSAIIYWAISYSYFTGKKIYQILSEQEGISYFNAGSFYDFGESSLGQRFFDLAGFFYDAFIYSPALVVYLAGFLGLVLLMFHPKGRVISLVFILYTAPFLVAMLAGRMFLQERMLFFSYVIMAMGAGYTVSRFVGLLRFNGWRRLSRTAFIVYLLFCVLPFAHSHWEMANRTPPGISEGLEWLKENRKPGEIVHYDFLEFWEHVLLVNSVSLTNLPPDYTYSNTPELRETYQSTEFLKENLDNRLDLQVTLRAHRHLLEYRPEYIVLAGPERWKRLEKVKKWHGKHLRSSYLRPYLHETGKEGVLEFQSDLIVHTPFEIVRVYSNRDVEIYRWIGP